jgi:hypothetical protein
MAKTIPPEDLSRVDHIREEAKRAAEFARAPTRPISMAPRFRVEGLAPMPLSPAATISPNCDEAFKNDFDFKAAVPRSDNPFVRRMNPEVLCSAIEADLQRLDDGNRSDLVPQLLEHFADLAFQSRDVQGLETLHRRVLIAAFGEGYFKNMGGREGSRTARK